MASTFGEAYVDGRVAVITARNMDAAQQKVNQVMVGVLGWLNDHSL